MNYLSHHLTFTFACSANRAFVHLKTENYGLAIQDAQAAITEDPSYLKGYYRLGSAYLALGKHRVGPL
jgi:serine/threonine-protein phosphatase 5